MPAALLTVLAQTPEVDTSSLENVLADETTGWEWVMAGSAIVAGIVLGLIVRKVFKTGTRTGEEDDATLVVARAAQWFLLLCGIAAALGILDVRVTILVGALGIGGIAIVLALQPTLENLFAGLVLHTQRPFRVGEEIASDEIEGRVIDITARSVVVQSFEGERVFVPNTVVLDREVRNRVRHGRRRTTIDVGVAYSTDLRRAADVLLAAAYSVEGVLDTPPPRVFAKAFGDNAIEFELDIWHRPNELIKRQVRSQVVTAVHEMLAAADITIPFPQRTLWWGGSDEHGPDLVAMAEHASLGLGQPEDDATIDDELTAEDLVDHDPAAIDRQDEDVGTEE